MAAAGCQPDVPAAVRRASAGAVGAVAFVAAVANARGGWLAWLAVGLGVGASLAASVVACSDLHAYLTWSVAVRQAALSCYGEGRRADEPGRRSGNRRFSLPGTA